MGLALGAVTVAAALIAASAAWNAIVRISGITPADTAPEQIMFGANEGIFPANARLEEAEMLAKGQVHGPEDMLFDSGDIFTCTSDGWVKRISFSDAGDLRVHNWTFVGGRPLGLVRYAGDLVVCEPFQGLLHVSQGHYRILTNKFRGQDIQFADGVDVKKDGMIYFSDVSSKYNMNTWVFDLLEGRPHGRLFEYDPQTDSTSLLLDGLYFPNGVALSPSQDFLVFCESSMLRCRKYWLEGPNKGNAEPFIDGLPGFPDNIRLGSDGHFWIAFFAMKNWFWRMVLQKSYTRHMVAALWRVAPQVMTRIALSETAIVAVDLHGKVVEAYGGGGFGLGKKISFVTMGVRNESYLYIGSLHLDFIGRIPL